MNNKFLLTMAVMLTSMAAFAQSLSEGFYRVQNFGSGRYLYVKDCTGDVSTLGSDFYACELWHGIDSAACDPGSVMYLEKHDAAWDITSQTTGVYALSGKYMTIGTDYYPNYCTVYNSGQYLYQVETCDSVPEDIAYMDAKKTSDMPGKWSFAKWKTYVIDSSTDCYFGFKPTVTAGGKHYSPFVADFAYEAINGQKTWYVSKVDKKNSIAVITEISGRVAKQQPVFVECQSEDVSKNRVDLYHTGGTVANGNQMAGVYFDNADRSGISRTGKPAVVAFDAATMRVLGTDEAGNLAFVSSSSNLRRLCISVKRKWVYQDCIPHNTSYLTVDADCPATLRVMTEAEYEEYIKPQGIESTASEKIGSAPVYDLNGRLKHDNEAQHGIYIVGGRKIVK